MHSAADHAGAHEAPGESDEARELAAQLIARWYNDPVRFAWDVLGVQLWRAQRRICKAIARSSRGPVRVAVKSGHKIGKSLVIAVVALWWWVTRPAARVIMTAPTARQIRSILWREIRKLWGLAADRLKVLGGLGGRLHEVPELGLQHIESGQQSEVLGFSTKEPERMAGISGENILYLIDEASGIGRAIFEAIDGNRAGGASVLMFSNPTQTSGEFYDAFNGKKHLYICFSFSSEETPNVKARKKVLPGLATWGWIVEKREEYGPDYLADPRYRVRVLGEFPLQAADQVVSLKDIERAHLVWYTFAAQILRRELPNDPKRWRDVIRSPSELAVVRGAWRATTEQLQLGVDPARYGDDLTIIYPRRGLRLFRPRPLKFCDGQEIADEVMACIEEHVVGVERPRVLIDAIGIGASAHDFLKHKRDIEVFAVNSGEGPTDGNEDEFINLRAEIGLNMRSWIRAGGGFEPDQRLQDDLLAPKYFLDGVGRVQIESKKDLKKRIGRSPDHGDGAGLAVFDGAIKRRTVHLPTRQAPLRFADQPGRGFG